VVAIYFFVVIMQCVVKRQAKALGQIMRIIKWIDNKRIKTDNRFEKWHWAGYKIQIKRIRLKWVDQKEKNKTKKGIKNRKVEKGLTQHALISRLQTQNFI
jgi:hypothetical protein